MLARPAAMLFLTMLFESGCAHPDARRADILLFTGIGASPTDVKAIEKILERRGKNYSTADSAALDAMSAAQLRTHRLLIIPGGNFEVMGNSLRPATASNVRNAVNEGLRTAPPPSPRVLPEKAGCSSSACIPKPQRAGATD